jgi:hypothetical protein
MDNKPIKYMSEDAITMIVTDRRILERYDIEILDKKVPNDILTKDTSSLKDITLTKSVSAKYDIKKVKSFLNLLNKIKCENMIIELAYDEPMKITGESDLGTIYMWIAR